jgi:two-component system response regulator NreC
MKDRIRVVLAEDHETVRQGLRALLATVPEVEIIDEAADAESAVARVRAASPDVLVLDLSMPGPSGLTALRAIREEELETGVVVLTRHRDAAFVQEAFAVGAIAYVLKQSPFSELQRAISHAARGERYVDRQLAARLREQVPVERHQRLSNRETDVLRRAALGHGNKEIAVALGIAVKTVEVHKAQGMRKLGLRDRSDLIRFAGLLGWLSEPEDAGAPS